MRATHLVSGRDVILPQYFAKVDEITGFEKLAREHRGSDRSTPETRHSLPASLLSEADSPAFTLLRAGLSEARTGLNFLYQGYRKLSCTDADQRYGTFPAYSGRPRARGAAGSCCSPSPATTRAWPARLGVDSRRRHRPACRPGPAPATPARRPVDNSARHLPCRGPRLSRPAPTGSAAGRSARPG
jgi:hypothetical protein